MTRVIIRPDPKLMLAGPYGEIKIGEVTISIWAKPGHANRIDGKRHGKMARHAADMRPADAPNPCIIPLDPETATEGGPFVYAHVFEDPDAIKRRNINPAVKHGLI